MRGNRLTKLSLMMALSLILLSAAFAHSAGAKQKFSGVIVEREADSIVLRTSTGVQQTVTLAAGTEIKEKKKNFFRGAKKYEPSQLVRGLIVEVEGRTNDSGALVAEKVRVTQDDMAVAQTVDSRVMPVETRVGKAEVRMETAETRLGQTEDNAKRMGGQIDELGAISNAARGGAKAAQETADSAVAGVQSANERIAAIDDYQPDKSVAIQFKVNSATLSPEAKAMLDELATHAKNQKGFVIEIAGFASADGSTNHNRLLSQYRADAVVRYLTEEHDIPLRRIIIPFGYGELRPVADNATREGRVQNRRVEVRLLVSRGLVGTATSTGSAEVSQQAQQVK